ncbi:MAG: methylated-DNA--[protein]-cysteine S-methyltransferase [Planctomycetota bacterium]|nr:methylated-DNA--[protein]-cysteine S-methyltransferase [Planctomycetota bacterium]
MDTTRQGEGEPVVVLRRVLRTPLGWVEVVGGARGVRRVGFLDGAPAVGAPAGAGDAACADAARCAADDGTARGAVDRCADQVREYFAGARRAFDVPLDAGGTAFQRRVWALLAEIPYGETTTYGEIARRLGDARAVRAVGAANGANPIAMLVPCHRVLASDGTLHGYAGGLERKRALLELEGALGAMFRGVRA